MRRVTIVLCLILVAFIFLLGVDDSAACNECLVENPVEICSVDPVIVWDAGTVLASRAISIETLSHNYPNPFNYDGMKDVLVSCKNGLNVELYKAIIP